MRQNRFSTGRIVLYCLGALPVVWIALLIAPFAGGGLIGAAGSMGTAMSRPFHIEFCEDSLRTVLLFLFAYALAVTVSLSSERNYRRREEHGSARWGNTARINRKYAGGSVTDGKILLQHIGIGMDTRRHRRNLNVLVCGGSGSGKTRFYAKPNIMNANCSQIILDPKRAVF